jgi:4-hydroxybenzoate polyprenyltransferase
VTAFCAAVVVLPFLLSYQAVRPGLDPWVELVVVGLGLLAIGRMTWWSLPDRDADAATGMRTPSVRYGAARTLAVAGILMLTGLSLLTWGLWWRYGPVWVIPVAAAHGAFLYSALRERRPSSVRMRRTGMTLVMVGEVLLVAVPLLAG